MMTKKMMMTTTTTTTMTPLVQFWHLRAAELYSATELTHADASYRRKSEGQSLHSTHTLSLDPHYK